MPSSWPATHTRCFWQGIDGSFLPELRAHPVGSLDELNRVFAAWLEQGYHHRVRRLNAVFKALADPTRRRILELLRSGDLNAGDIAERFNLAWPSISHHLSLLKMAGLVTADRRGKHIIYSLNMTVLQDALAWFLDFRQREGDGDEDGLG